MYQIIFFIAVILMGIYISKNNYKKRAKNISSNLFEYVEYILESYGDLKENEKIAFLNSLTPKEKSFFQDLKNNSIIFNENLNTLQSQMGLMEGIMIKLKGSKTA